MAYTVLTFKKEKPGVFCKHDECFLTHYYVMLSTYLNLKRWLPLEFKFIMKLFD